MSADGNQIRAQQSQLPQPVPDPPPIPTSHDVPYPGTLRLRVDATDVERGIFRVQETLPVARDGRLTLLYPKWLPGFHAPASAIELLAGLELSAAGARLDWRRDPVEVHAFHVDVPAGVSALDIAFQFLSPTTDQQGDIAMTPTMLAVQWAAMVLYPAGYYSRQIAVEATLALPDGWRFASALEVAGSANDLTRFAPVTLDVLVDSPVLAGRWFRRIDLDTAGAVGLDLVADRPDQLAATDEQLAPHRALVAEADVLFGARPYDHFDFLVALSDELGGAGVEHRRSCEIVLPPAYFTNWEPNAPKRDVFAHEYSHAWNGKFRRGADSWTPSFERPIRNSLMWVYEGQSQYWGEVLAVRSGLWTPQQARDTLARTAALYANRPGGRWRPMSDTTRDPMIAERQPLPWPSWQRSEDYYSEGQLLWLEVDTLIRELSGETRSLDHFARRFFGMGDRRIATCTYTFDDVVASLGELADHDWRAFLTARLESREVGAPLGGLERGGYRLVYRETPSDFALVTDAANSVVNLRFSIGVTVTPTGALQEVIWESPAFQAGLVAGATILAVNGRAFDVDGLRQAITDAQETGLLELTVQRGQRISPVRLAYAGGHRFPHLERIEGARARLDEIFTPRR